MVEADEQEILAKIRTLLALERNYLAEERTALAEFRAGLTLAIMAPSASAVVAYTFSILPLDRTFLFDMFVFALSTTLTIIGIWMSLRSRSKLKKVWKREKKLRDREATVIRSSRAAYDLLGDFMDLDER